MLQSVLSCAGNDRLFLLTSAKGQKLRIKLRNWNGRSAYAEYCNFRVGSEDSKYALISLGNYEGDAGWRGINS